MSKDFEPFENQLSEVLQDLATRQAFRTIDRPQDASDYDYDLTTNNYYGFDLADQEELIEIINADQHNYELDERLSHFYAKSQSAVYGGSTGSRLISGNYDLIRDLETRFGNYMSKSTGSNVECLLFNSGYHANIGIIPCLAKLNDSTLVLMDQLVHASIIDGVLLSGLNFKRFKHNDLESLEKLLKVAVEKYENIIIAVESIYSMDGDGPETMRSLALLKAKYADQANIILYCDEAHAVGLFGHYRFGRVEEECILNQYDIVLCPLGKAINSFGCLVFCRKSIKDYIVNTCRSFIYSTALPATIVEDIDLSFMACSTSQLREKADQLFDYSEILRENIFNSIYDHYSQEYGLSTDDVNSLLIGDFQITCLILGSNEAVIEAREYFKDHRVKVSAIRYPTVPTGKERIRISLTAEYNAEDLDKLSYIFDEYIASDYFRSTIEQYVERKQAKQEVSSN